MRLLSLPKGNAQKVGKLWLPVEDRSYPKMQRKCGVEDANFLDRSGKLLMSIVSSTKREELDC
tara:strand:- start:8870 stop:9058 length:189 start_codon:yes stop_codon:yes gene_type:complete